MPSNVEIHDVIIIGAGISGINAAYRMQSQLPGSEYTILEARHTLGGTWDLFKYPGIRSDSDLHTFGFQWMPWTENRPIADGESIKRYMDECTKHFGIDKKIQYNHKVLSGNWDSKEQTWVLELEVNGTERKQVRGRFVILGTGYYDYNEPLPTTIPGLQNFKGTIVHPQFWPSDLDYADKKVVVVGSGATAITLLPSLADKAKQVIQLQRSPSYILSLPNNAKQGWLTSFLPRWMQLRVERVRNLVFPFLFFRFCRAFPNAARNLIRLGTTKQLPKNIPHDPHFEPTYNPWEQRMCLCPDGDFYAALKRGNAEIVTDTIQNIHDHGIDLASGNSIEDVDIIVTATGLKIQLAGGATWSVDGAPVNIPSKFLWRSVMLQDTPNLAFVIGYTNASWTPGADATAQLVARLLRDMKKAGQTSAVPRLDDSAAEMKSAPVLNLNSTYIKSAMDKLPKTGDKGPWVRRDNYFSDIWTAKHGDLKTGLEFVSNSGAGMNGHAKKTQ